MGYFKNIKNGETVLQEPGKAKRFEDKQQQEAAFDRQDGGVRAVLLKQIVGSVGRYQDFDDQFRLKRNMPSERLENIKALMKSNQTLPPVVLYQIKDEYFVLDGNHRIAAAKELGFEYIDAQITEFLPSRNTLENVLYRERIQFFTETKLPQSLLLTEVGQYSYLKEQISSHQQFLEGVQVGQVSFDKAAADWYDTIYQPLVRLIVQNDLLKSFPDRTVADLYAYITFHQWEKRRKREYGQGIDRVIPRNMEEFRAKSISKKGFDLPVMKPEIQAFMLIGVKIGKEYQVMDRLFRIPEVQEVHFVHGQFDLLTKISLKRELLSSDAEVIGHFVHHKVRKVTDIINTQTLIPIASKQKETKET